MIAIMFEIHFLVLMPRPVVFANISAWPENLVHGKTQADRKNYTMDRFRVLFSLELPVEGRITSKESGSPCQRPGWKGKFCGDSNKIDGRFCKRTHCCFTLQPIN